METFSTSFSNTPKEEISSIIRIHVGFSQRLKPLSFLHRPYRQFTICILTISFIATLK
jgi:hypothetical protein